MGRKVTARRDYVKDSMAVYRMREALRLDTAAPDTLRAQAIDRATAFMEILMKLDESKGANGNHVTANRKTKG